MKKGRFSEEQIIGILKRHEAGQKVTMAPSAQQPGLPDTGRVRSSVATPFVLGSVRTAAGTARKGSPYGALTRGLDGTNPAATDHYYEDEGLTVRGGYVILSDF